jgi:type II secretory pathway component PulM
MDPAQYAAATQAAVNVARSALATFDDDAIYVSQLRASTPGALAQDPSSQEAFYRSLLRIQNPNVARVNDDMVFNQMNQEGVTGEAMDSWRRFKSGIKDDTASIQRWLDTINPVITARIATHDAIRRTLVAKDRSLGLDPEMTVYDRYSQERGRSAPLSPVARDVARLRGMVTP